MSEVLVDNIKIEIQEAAKKEVSRILDLYLGRPESTQDLGSKISEAAKRHKESPRTYGQNLLEYLSLLPDTASFATSLRTGTILNILLDTIAFPSQGENDPAIEGWPLHKYLPDGFSFLSLGDDINRSHADTQHGEKIRIDKRKLLDGVPQQEFQNLAKKLVELVRQIPKNAQGKREISSIDQMRAFYQCISDFIQISYAPRAKAKPIQALPSQSVLLNAYLENPAEALCRHRELLAQVMLQTFGLPGEILECHMYVNDTVRGNHLATLLKTPNASYLVDFTNPDFDKRVFMEEINSTVDTEVDVNKVLWSGKRRVHSESNRTQLMYLSKQSEKKVYYRIRRDSK